MAVNMIDALPAVFIAIKNDTITGLIDLFIFSDLLRGGDHFAGDTGIGFWNVIQSRNRRFRCDNDMNRSLRIDISEGDDVSVFIYNVRRDLVSNNFFENSHGSSYELFLSKGLISFKDFSL